MESKKKVLPWVEVIIVDNRRWNKIVENQIKFIDVAKEWMHGCMMENVHKIKIKLKNIWIDLIRSIYALYMSSSKPWSIIVSILLTSSFSRIITLSIPAGWSRAGWRSKNSGQWFGLHSLQTWIPLNISGVVSREGLQSMKTLPMESMNCGKGFKWSGPVEECQKLIESMPRRVQAVLKAKGGYTKYW